MILIGVPIRDIKEYAIERWLKSVAAVAWHRTPKLFMVDNSDGPEFSGRVSTLCLSLGLDYQLDHLPEMSDKTDEERLVQSRERIRSYFLQGGYTHWFSWECDIILPPMAMIEMRKYPQFDVVNHTYPDRHNPIMEAGGIGCSLYKRKILEKFPFDENGGFGQCDHLIPNCYYSGDSWLVTRLLRAGHTMIDLHNVMKVEHLGNTDR